ncbi:MAG: hypothetical protein ACOC8B_05180 [Gemmatimonadota bacterium]
MSRSAFYEGGKGSIQGVAPLGTSSVSDDTEHIIGVVPKKCRVTSIRFYGQEAPTATTLTAQVEARTLAGASGDTITSATDIDFDDEAAAKAGVEATLTSTDEDLILEEGQLLELHIDADSASAGPGDLLTEVEFEPLAT